MTLLAQEPDTQPLPESLLRLPALTWSLWQTRHAPLLRRLWPRTRRWALLGGVLLALVAVIPFAVMQLLMARGAPLSMHTILLIVLFPVSHIAQSFLLAAAVRWAYARLWSQDEQMRLLPIAPETRLRSLLALLLGAGGLLLLTTFALRMVVELPVHIFLLPTEADSALASMTFGAALFLGRALPWLPAALTTLLFWLVTSLLLLAQLGKGQPSFARQFWAAFLLMLIPYVITAAGTVLTTALVSFLFGTPFFRLMTLERGYSVRDAALYGLVLCLYQLPSPVVAFGLSLLIAAFLWRRWLPQARGAFAS